MFNFKKIASVLTSAVMLSSTMGFAMAASYPAPFIESGLADAAVVYGANAAVSDVTASIDIQQKLGALATSGSATTGASVTGEAVGLFSGGTKLYINDTLDTVKTVLTKSDLPTVLKDESFSGNVDATITQTINIGSNPQVTFAKQPTSSDDPNYALKTSTTQANYIYNATATFNKAVNLSHADSEGESISLFGQTFTVAAATDVDTLVLLKSAEKISLTSDNPSADVTISGSVYTVELVSSSDTAATIKVTDSSGTSESKEISEAASKKVNGIEIAVTSADENNLILAATVVAGSDKFTLEDGSSVTQGSDNTVVDGTVVDIPGDPTAATSITISVYASESDMDAIKAGEGLVDPMFGSFKLDFSGLNIDSDTDTMGDSTARETIEFNPNGDDKMDIKFSDHRGNEKTVTWANNKSAILSLQRDDDYRNISVKEMENLTYQDYVVLGNEDEGYLLRLSNVKNQSSGYSNDACKFTDVFSGDVYEVTWTKDGQGTLSVGGKSYTVDMYGVHTVASESYQVKVNQPDSGVNSTIIFPTIQTEKGAKVMFYEPAVLNITDWDDGGSALDDTLTTVKIPDGNGYTDVTITFNNSDISIDGGTNNITAVGESAVATIGQLKFNFTGSTAGGGDEVTVYLLEVDETGNIIQPAVVVMEEEDDNNQYHAIIVELEAGATGDDGLGIDSLEDTWSNADSAWTATRASDSKLADRGDLFGTIVTKDSSDSDQPTGTISYPDEQVYAQIYMAEEGAAITPGTTGGSGGGQVMIVKDSEVSSVASKNLFVVGGSCVNTVAAKILGSDSPMCTSAFTEATGVGMGQYIIKTVTSPYSDDKVAMLVAGYDATDTINAVAKAAEGVTSDVDTEQVYPITSTDTEEATE